MTVADLETLYDYGYWANSKLFAVMRALTPEQFTREVAGSYGSLRNTLVHTLSAEAGWLGRCGGPERGPRLDPADFPTLESVQAKWQAVERDVRAFLRTLTDDDLGRVVEFSFDPSTTYAMPVAELLHHAANHGVHHRGQVTLLLRALGVAPVDVDVLFYFPEKRSAKN